MSGLTLSTLAMHVEALEKRIAALEQRGALVVVPPRSERATAAPYVVNRGRWWYVLDAAGNTLNGTGYKTCAEAEAFLASLTEAKAA